MENKNNICRKGIKQPNENIAFKDEIIYLERINNILSEELKEVNEKIKRIDEDYKDFKNYMVQNRGEIDPQEMFQNELLLKQKDHIGMVEVQIRDRIAKIKDSAYFARIDFVTNDSEETKKVYIGRFSYIKDNELLIFDWRSPIASMFYDYEIGPAEYNAPIGKIEGKLILKRQFKITDGKLEYAFDNEINIQDNILQKELSKTSDQRMKSIITTIQREQNKIIRDENSESLIIQGVAGSGKTSIALHRIAFLLYRFKNKLSAKDISIISPNKVFGDYISNVLPELGEEPICQLSIGDIAKKQLDGITEYEEDIDCLESNDSEYEKRVMFKSTLEIINLMDEYLDKIQDTIFIPNDYIYESFVIKASYIKQQYNSLSRYPIKIRLKIIAESIYNKLKTEDISKSKIPKQDAILKCLNSMLTIKNTLSLYKDFYKSIDKSNLFIIKEHKKIEWIDVFPFLYLHSMYAGLKEDKSVKHLVIDEMQDYTPVQYAVINSIFDCSKTILGDFSQFTNKNHKHTLSDIKYLFPKAQLVKLTKSYRSTYEIMTFAKSIQIVDMLEPIERHGEIPQILYCSNINDEILEIKKLIKDFEENGNTSLGIIMKTNNDARKMHDILCKEFNINLILPNSTNFKDGISLVSINMSKGLEFDEVIIPSANESTYFEEHDKNLLYIACTRAMHRLALTCTGKLSPFIDSKYLKVKEK